MRKKLVSIGVFFITLGLTFGGLFTARNDIYSMVGLKPINGVETVFLLLAFLGIFVGFLSLSIGILSYLFSKTEEHIINRILEDENYECRSALENEIPELYALCVEAFGDDVASIDTMKSWYKKNNNIFWVIENKRKSGLNYISEIVGYFDVLPITNAACRLLDNESINGIKIKTEHIVDRTKVPSGIYIGGLYGKKLRAKAVTIVYLKRLLEDYKTKGVGKFYTRPTSKDGLRLVKKHNFNLVSNQNKLKTEIEKIFIYIAP